MSDVDSAVRIEAVSKDDLAAEICPEYASGHFRKQLGESIHGAYIKRMVDYCNGMMIYEKGCGEELKEYPGQELRHVPYSPMLSPDLLFTIFATPLANETECGWRPSLKEASCALVSAMEFQMQVYMNNRNLDTAKLIPLGVLVAKCISVYKLPDINPPSTVTTSAAEHVIPHLMTVLNTNAWAELQCGRSPCSQQFHTARTIFIKQLNNVVNMVVKSVPPRPNLNVAFNEI